MAGAVYQATRVLALCQSFLADSTHAEDVALVAEAGLSALHVDRRKIDATGVARAAREMAAAGVKATGWAAAFGMAEARSDMIDVLRRAIDDAATLGAPRVLVVAGALLGSTVEQCDQRFAEVLNATQPLATEAGISIMIEPLHPIYRELSYVHTVGHAAELAATAPGVSVCVDLAHVYWDRRFLHDLRRAGSTIVTVQLSNLVPEKLAERCFVHGDLPRGAVPLVPIVRQIDEIGFTGSWELQIPVHGSMEERLVAVRRSAEWFRAALPPPAGC